MKFLLNKYINLVKVNAESIKVYFFQLFTKISSSIVAFLLGIFIVRICGIKINGEYNVLLSYSNLVYSIFAGGILVNFLRHAEPINYKKSLFALTAMWIFFLPILIFSGYYLKYNIILLILIYIVVFAMRLLELNTFYFRLKSMDKKVLLPNILPYAIGLILILTFKPKSINILIYILLISWLVPMIFIFKELRSFVFEKVSSKEIIKNLKESSFLIFFVFCTYIFSNSDIFFINYFTNSYQVGLYKISTTFSSIILVLLGVFGNIFLSKINNKNYDNDNRRIKYRIQIRINLLLSIFFFIFSFLFNKLIIPALYGSKAVDSVTCSIFYSFALIPNALSLVNTNFIFGKKIENKIYLLSAIAILINLASNYYFISRYGIIGGAFSSFITFSYIFLHTSIIINKNLKIAQ